MNADKEPSNKPSSVPVASESALKAQVISGNSPANHTTVSASTGSTGAMVKEMPLSPPLEGAAKAVDTSSTKMETATEIFKRMRKIKGSSRKEIIEQFVAEAKLSKAGAATYYQLIKAKVK